MGRSLRFTTPLCRRCVLLFLSPSEADDDGVIVDCSGSRGSNEVRPVWVYIRKQVNSHKLRSCSCSCVR